MQNYEPTVFQDQLLRGLTHKMNNILSLFHGYLGMIMDDQHLDANTISGLACIQEGASSASALMDRTQALIRPASVLLREVDIREFLTNSMRSLEISNSRGIRLELACEDNPPMGWSDPARLRAILSELVTNAIEASPDNETVRIEAGTEQQGSENSDQSAQQTAHAVISIANKGNAMSPETLKKAFEPFFSTRQKRGAFGLGLPIASGIARQIGASIRFERINNETIFRVSLPENSRNVS